MGTFCQYQRKGGLDREDVVDERWPLVEVRLYL